jgi:hypothetical protein
MKDNKDLILKYYTYYYVDNSSHIYKGLISYEEDLEARLNSGWILNGEFYAINPYLRPIPKNMKLFSLELKNYYPYDILSYKLLYDIYEVDNLKDQFHVNFMTYNRPVLNTIPLYFYDIGSNILPSFDNKPPFGENYELAFGVNPIYVIKNKDVKFYCDNGECLPSPMPKNHFHYNMQYDDTLTFDECLNSCKNQGTGLLNIIEKLGNKHDTKSFDIKNIFNNNKIIIIICLLVFLFLIFIYNKRWIFG